MGSTGFVKCGIRYAGAFFEGPVPLGERSLPDQAELFAILVRRETADLRRVIYLGQSLARLPLYSPILPAGVRIGGLLRQVRRGAVGIVACLCLLLAAICEPVLAQGCAMCKAAVESQETTSLEALNTGILVLLFPPLLILSAIVFMAVWRNDP